jgi:hypothetical protein
MSAIASVLGIGFWGSDQASDYVRDRLRQHETLLVLDNFAHVLDGFEAAGLLVACADVRVPTNCREPAHLRWDNVLDVYPQPVRTFAIYVVVTTCTDTRGSSADGAPGDTANSEA